MKSIREAAKDFERLADDLFSENEKKQVARLMLSEYLELSSSDYILRREELIPTDVLEKINQDIKRLNTGVPLQYILGKTYFYGLDILTDKRALIPRPETEELIDWVLSEWKGKTATILDVGTGSGCIAFALQHNLPQCRVVGVDIMPEAIELARENAENLKLNVEFKQADALNLIAELPQKWDLIVSNPPYIPEDDKSFMLDNVLDHEPHSALFVSNEDPLIFYREIALYAKENLNEGGALYYEIHEDFALEMEAMLKEIGFKNIRLKKDLQDKYRMIKILSNQ